MANVNRIEEMAVLDYRIERLADLIASGQRRGLATRELEQALVMCIRNRAVVQEAEQAFAGLGQRSELR